MADFIPSSPDDLDGPFRGARVSGDIPGKASGVTGSVAQSQVTNLPTDLASKVPAATTQGGAPGSPATEVHWQYQPSFNTSTTVAPFKSTFVGETYTSTLETVGRSGYNPNNLVATEPSIGVHIHPNAEENAGNFKTEWGVSYYTKGGTVSILPFEVVATRRIAGVDDTVGSVDTAIRCGKAPGNSIQFENGDGSQVFLAMSGTTFNASPGVSLVVPVQIAGTTQAVLALVATAATYLVQNSAGQFNVFNATTGGSPLQIDSGAPDSAIRLFASGDATLGNSGHTLSIPANVETASTLVVNRFQAGDPAAKVHRIRPSAAQAGEMLAIENGGGTTVGGFYPGGFLLVGAGTLVKGILSSTATLDFINTSSRTSSIANMAVTGAAVGDAVAIGIPAAPDANSSITAWVSSAGVVTLQFNNYSAGDINPASGTYRATVFQF